MAKRPQNLWTFISTVPPFGLSPWAPGTFGSIAGLPLGFLLLYWLGPVSLDLGVGQLAGWLGVLLGLGVLSYVAIRKTEELWKVHDDKSIVVDEVVGQVLAMAACDMVWWQIGLSFLLFRVLDIAKPGPIGYVDRRGGAFSTLGDDVIAGLVVGLGFFVFQVF